MIDQVLAGDSFKSIMQEKAQTLSDTLSYLNQYDTETFVIKVGGTALLNPVIASDFASDIVTLKNAGINIILVHGGISKVNSILDKFSIKKTIIDGDRIADQSTIEIIEMVMSGMINKKLASAINLLGGTAIGISGKDGNLIEAKRVRKRETDPNNNNIEKILDMGFFGEVSIINPELLLSLEDSDIIPVISPIAIGETGETYQVNADEVACNIANTLAAAKLIILTDNAGVIAPTGKVITELSIDQGKKLLDNKAVSDNMISKMNYVIEAVQQNTEEAHIIDGRIPHSLLLELLTSERIGTLVHI